MGALVGFYTLYHDKKEGKYRMQVCTDLPCALRGADQFMEALCANLGIKVGETTADGLVTLEAVTCLAACDKAPMFQIQSADGLDYHENMTVDRTMELIEALKQAGQEVKPDGQHHPAAPPRYPGHRQAGCLSEERRLRGLQEGRDQACSRTKSPTWSRLPACAAAAARASRPA